MVSPKGGRVCANVRVVSSGKSDGVRSLFITGLKDECFTCISNCEGGEGEMSVCEGSEGVMSECVQG